MRIPSVNFDEAEARLRVIQARQKSEQPLSLAELETEVRSLTVQDDHGVWWVIHPETGTWFYHNGNEWVGGTRPGGAASAATGSNESSSQTSKDTAFQTRSTPATLTVAEKNYARAISGQQWRSRALPLASDRRYAWLPLIIGAGVLLCGLAAAWVAGRPAWEALTQSPTRTTAPLLAPATVPPTPTIVRLLTPPLPSATTVPVSAKVIEARVNIRAAPGLHAQVITTLPRDQRITLIARSEDSQWYQTVYQQGSIPGWIFSETLRVVEGNALALPLVSP